MKRRVFITAGLTVFGLLAGVTGCGMADTAGGSENALVVSDSTVVSGSAAEIKSSNEDMGNSRYANHNNIYELADNTSDEVGKEPLLVQMKADRTEVQRYEIEDLIDVAWVTDEWVYYVTDSPEYDILWRVPIAQGEDGDRLEFRQAEKLFQEKFLDACNVCVTDTGVFYLTDDEGSADELRRYDISKKESVLLKKSEDWMSIVEMDESLGDKPIMLGDSFFIQEDDKLYALDTVNANLREIYKGLSTMFWDTIVQYGDSVYFVPDSEEAQVYRYDGEKTECVIDQETMWKKIFDLGYPTGGAITIQKMFIYHDRMYFYVPVRSEHESGEYEGYEYEGYWYYKAQILLSAPVDDLLDLEGDKIFYRYMSDHNNTSVSYDEEMEKERAALKVGDGYYYDSPLMSVGGGWDGKLILKAPYFAVKMRMDYDYYYYDYAIYDLDTGEIEETEEAKAVQDKDVDAFKALIKTKNYILFS